MGNIMTVTEVTNSIKTYYGCNNEDIRFVSGNFIVRVCGLTDITFDMDGAIEIHNEVN